MAGRRNEKGFTIVEMVVVIAIMGLISGIMVAYNRTSDEKIALFSDEAKVVGVLQRAKAFALEKRGNACAFGVHFEEPATMIIFQDLPPVEDPRCVEENFNEQYDTGEAVEEISLDQRIGFTSLPGGGSSHDVVFIPPYLETSGAGTVEIGILGEATGSAGSCIEIGTGGQIYVNNDCSGT